MHSAEPSTPAAPPVSADRAVLPEETGLTGAQARRLLVQHGPNLPLPSRRHSEAAGLLLRSLAHPVTVLMLLAAGTYLALGQRIDGFVLLAALLPVTAVRLLLETRAERTLERLESTSAPRATVVRDEEALIVPAAEVVPGDLVVLREGDIVPADGVLVGGGPLLLDESALSGESLPVHKDVAGLEREVYAGTAVLAGRARARIVTTGTGTRYGLIGALVARLEHGAPPLEQLIRRVAVRLGALAALLCALAAGFELARGAGWAVAVIAGVSLAMAAIPEELPLVYALHLVLGAWRLTRGRALVRRLAGVELLGSTTTLCTDKTGTLTLGQLEVGDVWAPAADPREADAAVTRAVLEAALRASEPVPFDPLEQALVRHAGRQGIDVAALHHGELVRDYAFQPEHCYDTHVWRDRGGPLTVCAKGAVESLLARTRVAPALRDQVLAANHELAARGMRVLAVAGGTARAGAGSRDGDESALELLGLIAFVDPLRPGVPAALEECRRAGVRVVMITGDHPVTAHAVADGLGLAHEHGHLLATGEELEAAGARELDALVRDVNIFARTRPEQKLKLVEALRARGEIVALTGAGIGDAPALRRADIGIALGRRGSAVGREAASLVLLDDNFATLVRALRDGRRIFDNLARALGYLIAFHVALVSAALIPPLLGLPLLLLPVHLIALELIVHPTAALVFQTDAAAPDVMARRPRPPGAGLLAGRGLALSAVQGLTLFAGVLLLYLWAGGPTAGDASARALALTALVLGESVLVLLQRDAERPFWAARVPFTRRVLWTRALPVALLLAGLYVAPLATLLHIAPLAPRQWAQALAVALLGTLWVEPLKAWRLATARRREGAAGGTPPAAPPVPQPL